MSARKGSLITDEKKLSKYSVNFELLTRQYLIAEYKIYLDYNPNQPSTVDLFASIQALATSAGSFFSTETA